MSCVPPDHLLGLYLDWQRTGKMSDELCCALDRIIGSCLTKFRTPTIYWRTEDQDDLLQELRLVALGCLRSIKDPTNKRIFNYIKISIRRYLGRRALRLAKKMDREAIENKVLRETAVALIHPDFLFLEPKLAQVATLIVAKYSKAEIRGLLHLTPQQLAECESQLKEIYANE